MIVVANNGYMNFIGINSTAWTIAYSLGINVYTTSTSTVITESQFYGSYYYHFAVQTYIGSGASGS